MHQSLKTKIAQILAHEQISVAAFERRMGLNRNVIQNILRGVTKLPGYETLQAIAEACHCSVEELTSDRAIHYKDTQSTIAQPQLLQSVFTVTYRFITTNNLSFPSCAQLFGLIEEIYMFSLKSSTEEVDVKFAEWLLEKALKP